jgi:uncharacterized membrane protein
MTTAARRRVGDFERRGRFGLDDPERVAKALGWFSIGLGLSQIASPRGLTRLIGMPDTEQNCRTMQLFGIREITSGLGILGKPRPAEWMWGRVAGDAMDLAALGKNFNAPGANRNRVAAATAAVLGVTLLDYLTSHELSRKSNGQEHERHERRPITVREAITVQRPREEVYRFWHDFSNLPRFMEHLESVEVLDEGRSHWKAKAPVGSSVEWDAEIVSERDGEFIAWRSLQNADVSNRGSVRFEDAPGNRGTEVHVELEYEPPGGRLGAIVAKLFGEEPGQQVRGDLRRFKQVMELGEVVQSDASLHKGAHPARPPEREELAHTQEGGK